MAKKHKNKGFRGLQNYTTLKQSDLLFNLLYRFRGLQNYTTLKQWQESNSYVRSFRGLQNYTTLKQGYLLLDFF